MATICFDLDGTIVDPLLGVRNCVARVCREMGLTCPLTATIRDWIGFELDQDSFSVPGL